MRFFDRYAITISFALASLYWIYLNSISILDETLAFDSIWFFPGLLLPLIISVLLSRHTKFSTRNYLIRCIAYIVLSWVIYYCSILIFGWGENFSLEWMAAFFGSFAFIAITKFMLLPSMYLMDPAMVAIVATIGFQVGVQFFDAFVACVIWTIFVGIMLNLAFIRTLKAEP
jgi:hypothetical protein